MTIATLKARKEYLWVRGGRKWATPSLVLQGRQRSKLTSGKAKDKNTHELSPRFGFTVTRRIGNAVVRNRIKRRLRETVRQLAPDYAKYDYDYVLIGRQGALKRSFTDILRDLQTAFPKVHRSEHRS